MSNKPFKKPRTVTQTKITGYTFQPKRVALMKHEQKDVTQKLTSQLVASQVTATLSNLNLVAQGAGASERNGRRIVMKSLWVRWDFQMQPTTAGGSPFRIIVVYDKQNNAASPVALDILLTDEIGGMKNLSNERRFVTIMDEFIECMGTAGPQGVCGQRYVKLPNLVTEFNTQTSAVDSAMTTGLLRMLVYQNGRLITTNPTGNVFTRVRFVDQ